MTAQTPRRAGRPKSPILSRDRIFETALQLLDERGENGAGMREIARELGVGPSALYNHVSGHDDIITGVRELLNERIDVSGFKSGPWDQALRQWAISYRSAFSAHPPTIAVLAVFPVAQNSRTTFMWDEVCRGLMAAEWPAERVLGIIVGLESFILGSALDEGAPDDMLNPGESSDALYLRRAYVARERALAGARPADAAFHEALDTMLTGLRIEYAALGLGTDPK